MIATKKFYIQKLFMFQQMSFSGCGLSCACDPSMLKVMEHKLKNKFNPTMLSVVDPYGDMNSVKI